MVGPDSTLNPDILIDFLRGLIKDARPKVYMILNNLRVRHIEPLKAWLTEN